MLKLLYKPTGHSFVLPDEEVIRIKSMDRGNDYVILDGGLQEQKEEKLTEQQVRDIVLQDEEAKKKLEEEELKEQILDDEQKVPVEQRKPIEEFSRTELIAYAKKMGLQKIGNKSNTEIVKMLHEMGL